MQKVERQKHRDRKRRRLTWVILCAILLAISVIVGFLLRKKADDTIEMIRENSRHEAVTGDIYFREAEEMMSLTLKQKGQEEWTVVRGVDGKLRLQDETGETSSWTVDDNIAEMLTEAATKLTFDDVFAEKRSEWEVEEDVFGLKDPRVTAVTRFTDGTEVTVHIGKSADPENSSFYYMSVDGDERLFAVSAGIEEDFATEFAMLHPVPKLEIQRALLDRITVKNGDGSVRKEWKLQGDVADRDAEENWLLTAPFVYPADYDTINNMKENAGNLRLGLFVDEANPETLKLYGFEEPTAILEFHTVAGKTGATGASGVFDVSSWDEQLTTLTVGGKKGEMSSYILYEGNIYSISDFTMSSFLKTDPIKSVARYVVLTPLTSLEEVLVEQKGEEPVLYSLVVEEIPATEDEAAEEKYHCLKNGEEIPFETFAAAWQRLMTVTVSGRFSTNYEPGEAYIKYTFRTVNKRTHTVELSDLDEMHDAVTLDGHTRFYLIKGGMTELP